jgi:hypothetical protein
MLNATLRDVHVVVSARSENTDLWISSATPHREPGSDPVARGGQRMHGDVATAVFEG